MQFSYEIKKIEPAKRRVLVLYIPADTSLPDWPAKVRLNPALLDAADPAEELESLIIANAPVEGWGVALKGRDRDLPQAVTDMVGKRRVVSAEKYKEKRRDKNAPRKPKKNEVVL